MVSWAWPFAGRLVMDTIVGVAGSVGVEGRIAGSHGSTEGDAVGVGDDRSHVAVARSEEESLVMCSSRSSTYCPQGHSRLPLRREASKV